MAKRLPPIVSDVAPDFTKWGSKEGGQQPMLPTFPHWEQFTNWDWMDEGFKSEGTRIVYMGVDGSRWDLAGPQAGYQGVVLEKELMGSMSVPFEHRWSEGPYTVGSRLERTDIRKREISFGVVIRPNANSKARLIDGEGQVDYFRYRTVEARWFRAWSKTEHGHLGFFTRSTGWRWLKVLLNDNQAETISMDPAAFNNSLRQVPMNLVAPDPYAYKRAFKSRTWTNVDDPSPSTRDWGEGLVRIVNRGQVPAWPKFIVTGPGKCELQDSTTGKLIPCPELFESDGYMMVDTDPTARTFTTSKEPVDNAFYRFIRDAELAKFFLHDLGAQGLPAWRRSNGARFTTPIPAETAMALRVRHTNPSGQVTCFVPQAYETAW